jgi:hypothetical protein
MDRFRAGADAGKGGCRARSRRALLSSVTTTWIAFGAASVAMGGAAAAILESSVVEEFIAQVQVVVQQNVSAQVGVAVGSAGGDGGAGEDGGDGDDALVVQAAAQSNANDQTAVIGDLTADDVTIDNVDEILAGGDGIVGESRVSASIEQTQDVEQANDAEQTGTAVGGAGGAGGDGGIGGNGGVGGDGGNASVNQASAQSNGNEQSAAIGDLTAGDVVINNSADVHAGGDGLVATSQANAAVDQTQDAAQANDTKQTGTAVGGAGGAGGGGNAGNGGAGGTGGNASVVQAAAQSNANAQSASIGDLTAGNIVIDNSADIMRRRRPRCSLPGECADQAMAQANGTEQTGTRWR